MANTVIVNKMTAVHSSSNGTSIAFPDVCKTPIPPAGPVPIPYPNIAMSSDASKEVKKVKTDKGKLMGKGSKIKMSSGDEAGSAQGLVSSKIKGKAEFILYSFDVKAGGKNVCRLADPMQQNQGTANAAGPAVFQAPNVALGPQAEYCEKTNEKKEEQKNDQETNWGKAGVAEKHRPAFQEVADDFKLIIYVRWSNPLCTSKGWIPRGHRPKPHACFFAKTISGSNLGWVHEWYARTTARLAEKRTTLGKLAADEAAFPYAWVRAARRNRNVSRLQGVVLINQEGAPHHGMPLRASGKHGGLTDKDPAFNYAGKWITGDYDLYDIMGIGPDCERPDQTKNSFKQVKRELNTKMGWGGIQHGPQVQWCPRKKKGEPSNRNFPPHVKAALAAPDPAAVPPVDVGGRPIPVMAGEVLAVFPGGTVSLDSGRDVADALLCKGCASPAKKRAKKY
jgi:hypothetical protein